MSRPRPETGREYEIAAHENFDAGLMLLIVGSGMLLADDPTLIGVTAVGVGLWSGLRSLLGFVLSARAGGAS